VRDGRLVFEREAGPRPALTKTAFTVAINPARSRPGVYSSINPRGRFGWRSWLAVLVPRSYSRRFSSDGQPWPQDIVAAILDETLAADVTLFNWRSTRRRCGKGSGDGIWMA
jgi:hypothetical protein